MKTRPLILAALSMALSTGAAVAAGDSYTGDWKVSLTHDVYVTNSGYNGHGPNTAHCIALTDDGSVGWPHSGYAVMDNNANTSGQFAVIGPTILIYIDTTGSGEEPASLVFTGVASNGTISKKGGYDEIQGGQSYDADDAKFEPKGSC
jgi:hypothetical protein